MSGESVYSVAGSPSFLDQLDPRIRPPRCTKEQFEGRAGHIVNFTIHFFKLNNHPGLVITRNLVEFFWVRAVWGEYPEEHPEKSRLIGQARSPGYEIFWQKRNDLAGYKAKKRSQKNEEFWPFPRYATRDEFKDDNGVLILGNGDWEYIIPEVRLMPLYHVNFLALAKKAMDANPDKRLNIEMMRRLWRMLIDVVYAFDDESARTAKLLEADTVTNDDFQSLTVSRPAALSKKRETEPENLSGDERSEQRGHRSKRKKTVTFAETGATGSQINSESHVELAARPHRLTETNGQQPSRESNRSAPSLELLDKTKRIAILEAKLKDASREIAAANKRVSTAEQQAMDHKRERAKADQRLKSQNGQMRAAERRVRELIKANKHAMEDMEMRALKHQLNSLTGQLTRATQSESDLRAYKGRLEALLVKAGVDTDGQK